VKSNSTKKEMEAVSKRYLPDDKLKGPVAKLFRGLLNKLQMNPYKWTRLLNDHLAWILTGYPEEDKRKQILTKTGNIRDAYFHSPKLTADKMLEGLSILQMDECTITLRVKDTKGNEYEVSETVKIKHAENSESYEEDPDDGE
jgi:hypothetical protein